MPHAAAVSTLPHSNTCGVLFDFTLLRSMWGPWVGARSVATAHVVCAIGSGFTCFAGPALTLLCLIVLDFASLQGSGCVCIVLGSAVV